MPVKVGTVTIKGQEVEIEYNTAEKVFVAEFGESEFTAPTQDALVAKLRKVGDRQKPVAIPFTEIEDGWRSNDKPRVRHGTLTGLHSSSRNLLVRYEDGSRDQLRDSSSIYVRLTDAQVEEYWTLHKAQKAAEHALRVWKETHKMVAPTGAVSAALDNDEAGLTRQSGARGGEAATATVNDDDD